MKTAIFMLKLLRPRQWVKNGFVIVPIIFGLKFMEPSAWLAALFAFIIFSCVASAVYIFNDLCDMAADKAHPQKCLRPLASGALSSRQAYIMLALLILLTMALLHIAQLGLGFSLILGLYIVNSLGYSLGLKSLALFELFMVAAGYVLRVVAGCLAIGVEPSQWLLAATGVVALLIVTGKRRAEMVENSAVAQNRKALRGYNIGFLDAMISLLGGVTLVVYLLFTTSDYAAARYGSPYLVITSVFVAFGVLRYIQLIMCGRGAEAPTDLVTKDAGIAMAVLLWLCSFLFIVRFG